MPSSAVKVLSFPAATAWAVSLKTLLWKAGQHFVQAACSASCVLDARAGAYATSPRLNANFLTIRKSFFLSVFLQSLYPIHLLQKQVKGLDEQVLLLNQTWTHPHRNAILYIKGGGVLKKKA